MKNNDNYSSKKRYFYLKDDYRYHFIFPINDVSHFHNVTNAYLDLMIASGKENKYEIGNLDLTDREYKIINNAIKAGHNYAEKKAIKELRKTKFTLINGGKEDE